MPLAISGVIKIYAMAGYTGTVTLKSMLLFDFGGAYYNANCLGFLRGAWLIPKDGGIIADQRGYPTFRPMEVPKKKC